MGMLRDSRRLSLLLTTPGINSANMFLAVMRTVPRIAISREHYFLMIYENPPRGHHHANIQIIPQILGRQWSGRRGVQMPPVRPSACLSVHSTDETGTADERKLNSV